MLFSFKRALVHLALVTLIVPCVGIAQSHTEVLSGSRAAELESCVAPTEDMRRNHMKHLFHKRDKTMRQGIRTEEFSLNACVSCHSTKDDAGDHIPVNDEEQFCQSCHTRVSQSLDCFQCHRTTPES